MSTHETNQKLDIMLSSIEYHGDTEAFKQSFISKVYTQTFVSLITKLPEHKREDLYKDMAKNQLDAKLAPTVLNDMFTKDEVREEMERITHIAIDAYTEAINETKD